MDHLIRLVFIIGLSSWLLNSCAATASRVHSGPEIYQAGKVEIRLYQNRESMVKDIPSSISWLDSAKMGSVQVKLCGYFDREKNRIYAIDDARTVIHEIKHFLEPDWQHDEQTPLCDSSRIK